MYTLHPGVCTCVGQCTVNTFEQFDFNSIQCRRQLILSLDKSQKVSPCKPVCLMSTSPERSGHGPSAISGSVFHLIFYNKFMKVLSLNHFRDAVITFPFPCSTSPARPWPIHRIFGIKSSSLYLYIKIY